MSIDREDVYDAIRRGYSDLTNADDVSIDAYFEDIDIESVSGHIGNIKGILFEQEYVERLQEEGVEAELFEEVNHPSSDIMILEEGDVVEELQLKATESPSYIQETLDSVGEEVTVVTTTEIAQEFPGKVVDSGISEAVLEEAVVDVVMPISPVSMIGWLFGLF